MCRSGNVLFASVLSCVFSPFYAERPQLHWALAYSFFWFCFGWEVDWGSGQAEKRA
jgi:hypothetical protein